MKKHLCLPIVLLVTCTATTSLRTSTGVPSEVLEDVCSSLLARGQLVRNDRLLVVAETQPVSSMLALHYASTEEEITADQGIADLDWDETYKLQFVPEPIQVPTPGKCNWKRADAFAGDASKELLLEVSGIIVNPYSGETGVFVRYSYGGRRGASWYWLMVEYNRRGELRAKELVALEDYDN